MATQCRVLGVSTSGYYLPARSAQAGAWLKRPVSKRAVADLALKERIVAIHTRSFGTYLPVRRTQTGGAPRIHAQLAFEGTKVGRKRVARLLREMGLFNAKACARPKKANRKRLLPIWLIGTSGSLHPISSKWPTSPTFRPGQASFTFLWCWMPSRGASWDGQWTHDYTLNWS